MSNPDHSNLSTPPQEERIEPVNEEIDLIEEALKEFRDNTNPTHPFIQWLEQSKRFLFLLLLLTFGLLSLGGLTISSLSAHYGLMVFGSDPSLWQSKQSIALRLEGRELFLNQSIDLLRATVEIKHKHTKQTITHVSFTEKVGPYLQGFLTLPQSAGQWRIAIKATGLYTPLGRKKGQSVDLETYLDFTLLPQSSSSLSQSVIPESHQGSKGSFLTEAARHPTLLKERQGKGQLALFALQQRLSFELPSDLIISALNSENQPWSTSLTLDQIQGLTSLPLPQSVQTDASGLARLSVQVQSPKLQFQVYHQDTSTLEQFWPKAHHFTLKTSSQLLKVAQSHMTLEIASDRVHPFLFLDVWIDGVWSSTHALFPQDKRFQHILPLPKIHSAFKKGHRPAQVIWVQVYDSTYFPKERKGGTYVLRPYEDHTLFLENRVFPWLKKKLIDLKIHSKYWSNLEFSQYLNPTVIAFALGRFQRPDTDPIVLSDSGTSSQIMMNQMKQDYQKWFMISMLIFGCLVCIILALLMWNHHRKLQSQMQSSLDKSQNLTYSQKELWLKWFIPAFGLLICFFGGMVYLIWVLNQS